MKLRNFY